MKVNQLLQLVLFCLIPFLFIDASSGQQTLLEKRLWDLGHFPLFMLFAFLSLPYIKHQIPLSRNQHDIAMRVLACIVVLAVGIEGLQWFIGRSASFGDIRKDILGALIVYQFFYLKNINKSVILRASWLVTLLWFVLELYPVTEAGMDQWRKVHSMPILADFETEAELSRWGEGVFERSPFTFSISNKNTKEPSPEVNNNTLKLFLYKGAYTGIVGRGIHHNWQGYQFLQFDIFNPNKYSLGLKVKVEDQSSMGNNMSYQNRYNGVYQLQPGENQFRVPLTEIANAPNSRVMDMGNISRLSLFFSKLSESSFIYIDNIMLVDSK